MTNYGQWLRVELFKRKITQSKIAKLLNRTDRTIRNKIKNDSFTDEEKEIINEKLKNNE